MLDNEYHNAVRDDNPHDDCDSTDFGAYLDGAVAADPELSVLVAKAERELESEARLAAIFERLPRTADGVPFFIGDALYIPNPDRGYFGSEDVLQVTIESISKGVSFVEYRGDFTISGSGSDIEGGNLDFYSTREACPQY